ncbi:hypothetical protein RHMOL_Rhmol05G0112500 [Rhododendron molle]|uniref:Uncharacterized protein n=1 Tax=Rhododendron molle TaxID=49168 RepID=A0ACC0NN12_RHOML|nr:hypothetical protein RHMOL_Rhmol05G0112500 [Rhododendron molle]
MVQAEAAAATYQMQLLTESCSCTCSWIRWVHIHLLVTLVISAQAVLSGKIVKFLPGYDGELPFKLETGYISIDDSELLYYFVESEGNPQEDPLFLWLSGGPGCSSFTGLIYEAGPMQFDFQNYAGGLPKLKYYPYRWTKAASMIFLDSPVGAGFSYARNPEGWHSSDTKSAEQSYRFLGKGYLIGSPWTDSSINTNSKVEFAHGMALISDEIYENARRSCKENYVNVDPEDKLYLNIKGYLIGCPWTDSSIDTNSKDECANGMALISDEIYENARRSCKEIQKMLHVQQPLVIYRWNSCFYIVPFGKTMIVFKRHYMFERELYIRHWEGCNSSISYTKDVVSVVSVHKELSRSALEALVERYTIKYSDQGYHITFGTVKLDQMGAYPFAGVLVFSAQAVLSGKIVKFLPGYDGELPFKLETGYIGIDDSELFYYFVESEGNPQEDPLFLWLTGGPGCTSFCGLIYETGPMEFDFENYTGGLPKLKYYPYTWTKAASMIFLDSPVGTGFSYARNPEGWLSSDTKSAEHSYQFLRKWMIGHPQFLSVQLFIAGDSYAGIPIPLITKKIIDGNKDKDKLYLNIKGYLIGSPVTDSSIDTNSKVEFAHGMALISDEIYEVNQNLQL